MGLTARVPTGMDFRILGPLEVLDEGRAITLGGSKQRALLALLLLHANETLSTDRLIDELWGERPPANAAKTVQMQISRLRKALAGEAGDGLAGVVVTRERGYELRLDPDRLDSHRFERLLAEGRSELAGGHPERAVSALEGALSLWRGAPLAELAYEPFAQREIARLDDLRVARPGAADRGEAGARRPRRGGGAAGGADRRASLPGAPAGAADAGPLPLGPPGGRAAGLPGRAHGRWSRSSASSRASGYASSSGRYSRRTRDSHLVGGGAGGGRARTGEPAQRRLWAASASWPSWSAVSMTPSPAAGACSCSSASPASARAASPRS